jgi:poly(3-hydroxyalkanoate) synthetase
MPVLSVSAEKDAIAPPEGVDAIVKVVPHAEVLRLPGGHVGIVAGRTAASLWQRTVEFLATSRG